VQAVGKLVPVQQHRFHTPAWPSAGIGERLATHPGTSSWTPTSAPLNEQSLLGTPSVENIQNTHLSDICPVNKSICPILCAGVHINLFLHSFFLVVVMVGLQRVNRYQQWTHFFMNTDPVSQLVIRVTTHTHTHTHVWFPNCMGT